MTRIKTEADFIIDFIYKNNPNIPVEVLLTVMVQDGIRKGLQIAKEVIPDNTYQEILYDIKARAAIDKILDEK